MGFMPIFRFDTSSQLFEQFPGDLSSISVSVDHVGFEDVWGINRNSDIFRLVGNRQDGEFFQQVPGKLSSISTSSNGDVWGLNEDPEDNILRFIESRQVFFNVPGRLRVLANGGVGQVWGLSHNSDIFRFDESRQVFNRLPGKLRSIATNGLTAFGINQDSDIFRFNESRQVFEQIPGKLASISANNGTVWGLNQHSEIFEFFENSFNNSGPLFAQNPGKLTTISVDGPDFGHGLAVWGLNGTDIFRLNDGGLFEQVRDVHDRKLTRISVSASASGFLSVWGLFNISQVPTPTALSVRSLVNKVSQSINSLLRQIWHFASTRRPNGCL